MDSDKLISVDVFCAYHKIEVSFVESLHRIGLVEIIVVEERAFFNTDQISQLEKYVRLHYDLDINFEGLEAITHLLARVSNMQHEITSLRNRLRFFEENN